jgi:alpha-tubulin suppressor-like RCC1 family protein
VAIALNGITRVAAGGAFSIAVQSNGTVWSWGSNGVGQLGDASTHFRAHPVRVRSLNGVVQLDAGLRHTVVVVARDE